jgi:hypothetical protein
MHDSSLPIGFESLNFGLEILESCIFRFPKGSILFTASYH